PLTFLQFCKFWTSYRQDEKVAEFLDQLPEGGIFLNLEAYYRTLQEKSWRLEPYKPYINQVLKEYLLVGGYPEYFEVMNFTLWQKRLVGDIIGQGLYRDIVRIYRINSPERLEKLLYFITANN